MRLATTLRYLYLAYLSKPVADRALYRAVWQSKPRRILEIGIHSTDRTLRMLDLAQRLAGEAPRYAAIDLFEARAGGSKLALKEAHRLLKPAASQSQLIPGDPAGAVARVANSLPDIDLVLISAEHDDASLEGAWFYLPRMLKESSLVLRQWATGETGGIQFETVALDQIRQRATPHRRRAA